MVRHLGRVEADPVTGLTGREQILRRMRSAEVLLLLHGTEPNCTEYVPSKLYEYLWMQRPILATVHGNAQMAEILREHGHVAVETLTADAKDALTVATTQLVARWVNNGLPDNGLPSPYTTQVAVSQLLDCA
jgi:hypothetical protein